MVSAIVETLETRKMLSAAAPVIANVGTTVNYTEGAPPSILAGHATVTDASNAFASSTLSVKTTNGGPGDQLGILNGNGVGIGPHGEVMYAASPSATPTQIGTVTGGSGNSALLISFNSNATNTSVQAVLDQLGYGNGTSTFAIPDRNISFQFTDGSGVVSASVTKSVHVTPAPVVNNLGNGPLLNYTEGAPPVLIGAKAKISDASNAYNNSTLNVAVLNAQPGDQLGIGMGNGVGMGPNGAVLYSPSSSTTPVVIGTVTGGKGTTPLVVTFNSNATQAGVQAVLDQVVFGNGTSTFQTPDRQIGVVFTDGNHVASIPVITGIHVNPAPVISNLGQGPVNYKVNSSPVVLAPNATIADAPNAYANSKLTVQLSGGNSSDQLGIQANGSLTLGANSSLLYDGVVVGSFSGGTGAGPLVILFNANATKSAVQSILDNITFAYTTTSTTPLLTNRQAAFTFTDGNNVASATQIQGIHVTA